MIKNLQNHQPDALANAYHVYQSYFTKWANKQFPFIESELIEDVYQNALIVLIEKFIWTGKIRVEGQLIVGLTASVASFLTAIGKNMLLQEVRKAKRSPVVSLEDRHRQIKGIPSSAEEREFRHHLVRQAFDMLNEKEKDVIYFKYVLGHSYEEIRKMLNLKSADSLKTMCSRYMKRFRANFRRLEQSDEPKRNIFPRKKTDSDSRGTPSNSIE